MRKIKDLILQYPIIFYILHKVKVVYLNIMVY